MHRYVTHSTSRENRPNVTAREGTQQFAGSVRPIEELTQVAVASGSAQMETEGRAQQPPTRGNNRDAVVPQQVTEATQTEPEVEVEEDMDAVVPMVRVHLLQTICVRVFSSRLPLRLNCLIPLLCSSQARELDKTGGSTQKIAC